MPWSANLQQKSVRLPVLARGREQQGVHLDSHLLDKVLAARAHAAGRLAVCDAALDAAALGRGKVR